MSKKCIHCGSATVEMNPHCFKPCNPPLYFHTCSHCGATYYDNEYGTSPYARFELFVPNNYQKYTDFKKLYSDYKDMIDEHVDKKIKSIKYEEIIPLNSSLKSRIEYDMAEYRKNYSGYKDFNSFYKDYIGEINCEFFHKFDIFFKKINNAINIKINDKSTTDDIKQSLIIIKNIINDKILKYQYYDEIHSPLITKINQVEDNLRDFIYEKILTPTERCNRDSHRKEKLFGMFVNIFTNELINAYKSYNLIDSQQNVINTFNKILNDLKNNENEPSLFTL